MASGDAVLADHDGSGSVDLMDATVHPEPATHASPHLPDKCSDERC
jgi:hypothetical protein